MSRMRRRRRRGMGSTIAMRMKRRQVKGPPQAVREDLLRALLALPHDVGRPFTIRQRDDGASLRMQPPPEPGKLRVPSPLAALRRGATARCDKSHCTLGGVGRAHSAPQDVARKAQPVAARSGVGTSSQGRPVTFPPPEDVTAATAAAQVLPAGGTLPARMAHPAAVEARYWEVAA